MTLSLLQYFAACEKGADGIVIIPTWYKYLGEKTLGGRCSPVFNFPEDTTKILLAVFEIILRIGGLAAVGFVVYGGIQYIISQGNPDRVSGARTTIINALIGLAIALSATALVNLIGRNIT